MLAIGRALLTNPRLLILDEATEGLAPLLRREIWRALERLKAQGQSILLIDKNVAALSRIADRHYILEKGRVVWSGSSADLRAAARYAAALSGGVTCSLLVSSWPATVPAISSAGLPRRMAGTSPAKTTEPHAARLPYSRSCRCTWIL